MNMTLDPALLNNAAQQTQGQNTNPTVRILDRDGLLALGPEWENLVSHALEENAYYCRQYVEALFTHIETRPVQTITVWRGERLIALLPFTTSRTHWAGCAPLNTAWTTPYSMLTAPLIDRRDADAAAATLIKAMKNPARHGSVWLFPDMPLDGPLAGLFAPLLKEQAFPTRAFDAFDRATLVQGETFDTHMQTQVSRSRRKGLRRNRKRLQEMGEVSFAACTDGPDLDQAIVEFLRIEATGWKGARGTALDCSAATRNFAVQAFGTHKGNAITRADMLLLDDKPIAIILSLLAGRTAFTIKTAFDDAYRSQSAGMVLEEDMIRSFLEDNWADKLDSATTPGHVIQSLWNGSTRVGDVLLTAGPSPLPFKAYVALETSRRWARSRAKTLLASLRR